MSGFIYVWFDRYNKMFYVGSHWGPDNDGYVCSSLWLKKAYKKRPQDFKRRIVSRITSSRMDLLIEEQRWLSMIKDNELSVRYYNLARRANGWYATDDGLKNVAERISSTKQANKSARMPSFKEVKDLFSQGLRLPQVAKTLDVPPHYIRELLQANGHKSAKELFPKKETPPSRKPGDVMRQKWADPEWRERQRSRLSEGAKTRPPRSEESKVKARIAQLGKPKRRT